VKDKAEEVLVFQDEMEIHLHPTLTQMWGPVGQQPQIPSPSQNERRVVYGGVDYMSNVKYKFPLTTTISTVLW